MSFKTSAAQISALCLITLLTLIAIACGSEGDPGAESTPSTEPLTAEQVLALASSAIKSATSYRMEGHLTYDSPNEGLQEGTITVEWTAPDRMRQISKSATGDEPYYVRLIRIGDRSYLSLDDRGVPEWRETMASSSDDNDDLPFVLGLADPQISDIETLNGISVYRVKGRPADLEQIAGEFDRVAEATQTIFVSTSDFRPLRFEYDYMWEYDEETGGPERMTETKQVRSTMQADITYLSEPIVIEPPDSYIPLNEPDNSPAWTPTPTATRTPTPDLPPSDLQTFLSGLDEYDKMEIGEDIVVTFPRCEPGTGFVIHQITIIYLPDGSSVAKEYQNDEFSLGKFNSHEAKAALTAILNDSNLVAELLEKTARPARCPAEITNAMRAAFDATPDYDKYLIDDDTVAFFPSCDGYPTDTYSHPFVINHFPTETAIGVAADGVTHEIVMIGTPNGQALLEELVAREKDLMTELLAMAPKSERCESAG